MVGKQLASRIRRGLKKPPHYIAQRALHELRMQSERYLGPLRLVTLTSARLARTAGYGSIDEWWIALGARPPLAATPSAADCDRLCAGEHERIAAAARDAVAHRVDLLGSGPIDLGAKIDWHCDYKTGLRWQPAYCRDIDYNNPGRPSDVKFPWELSRMQWMIPIGQAYVLHGDERHAEKVRDVLVDWIASNPYGRSVNWACTMEVALRILTWIWFFHVFKNSTAWSKRDFRELFVRSLYLHGDFTARNLERSDINGNHFTADAAGLVVAGLFFGDAGDAPAWLRIGWKILCDELPRQVFPDGVDFEGSVPYHRLVQELFLLPAILRRRNGLDVPSSYEARLVDMARFTAAYSRPDGSIPLWGDNDDARALPFGGQPTNDHRYLLGIVGAEFGVPDLIAAFSGPRAEQLWLLGAESTAALPQREHNDDATQPIAFRDGGFYVLRNAVDHVFVDCGPVGLGGRGGHGHNDLLSFEAVLDGAHLVSDCGSYVYTANYAERNRFRSTAYHNTPMIDGEEINRFIGPSELWQLHDDARPHVLKWEPDGQLPSLLASHTGYLRLADPVRYTRELTLDRVRHALTIVDRLQAASSHTASIPFHLAPGVRVENVSSDSMALSTNAKQYRCAWSASEPWAVSVESARVSASYGRTESITRVSWTTRWAGRAELRVILSPVAARV
jgi:uncharacterized heparinase superfamily protein